MALHETLQAGVVAQEAHVPQLIELVRPDRALAAAGREPLDIARRRREETETGAGEGDLGCRSEHEGAVGVAGLLAQFQNVGDLDGLIGQVMHRVGIVPEHPEVRRAGTHARDALDGAA